MSLYRIVRFSQNKRKRTVANNLTLEEAREHCKDPSTKGGDPGKGTAWFDGYEVE